MITPEFLKSCTDEQINKGVAWCEASKCEAGTGDGSFEMRLAISQEIESRTNILGIRVSAAATFKPCTSPNDAWPIMMNNLISTTPRGGSSYAQPYASSGMLAIMVHCDSNEELLRAAMEVYILMSTQS